MSSGSFSLSFRLFSRTFPLDGADVNLIQFELSHSKHCDAVMCFMSDIDFIECCECKHLIQILLKI